MVTGAIAHVVGARPNFMKAAPVVRAIGQLRLRQVLIHTGQHYDAGMSDVFFTELDLPTPDLNLGVGSGSHASQTAALLIRLEQAFLELEPSVVVVYGDVNSSVAAALVAVKLGIPIAHVEAGLRSFDMTMPEEVNRRVTDLLSDLCFVTSPEAIGHLAREGVAAERIFFVGNPMIDTLLANLAKLEPGPIRGRLGLGPDYAVATLHRPSNVDAPEDARRIVAALNELVALIPVVLPLHPRGRPTLEAAGLLPSDRLTIIEPLGYIEFMSLVRGAKLVVTDSGGVQEETTILNVPCLTIRPNTERPITISHGTNRLVTPDDLVRIARATLDGSLAQPVERPPLWDGQVGPRIAAILAAYPGVDRD
jgi:UDP-N-acetylglucosamine 2-epimerase (non-hydrolysing)